MRALLAIREPKILTLVGPWHSGKKMPRAAFPLSRSHSYPLGSSFDWCVCEAIGKTDAYRILIAFDPAKAQYRGWLGLICGHDMKLLGRLEYHPDHKGWHIHWKAGPVAEVAMGVVKESRQRDRSRCCPMPASEGFSVSQLDALKLTMRAFNLLQAETTDEGDLFT